MNNSQCVVFVKKAFSKAAMEPPGLSDHLNKIHTDKAKIRHTLKLYETNFTRENLFTPS